jgi:hypothetical protein
MYNTTTTFESRAPMKEGWGSALTHPTHVNPEDGSSIYLQNVDNTVRIHTMQRPKSRININKEPKVSKTTIVRL